MVKLTQIEDENSNNTFPSEASQTIPKDEEYVSSSEEEDDSDDEFDEAETLLDRIVALKDIIPPSQRDSIYSFQSSLKTTATSLLGKTGSLLWVITSSALLLGVPLSLSILSEQQMIEMEKEMTLQQSSQELLAPGSESAFQEPKPAVV